MAKKKTESKMNKKTAGVSVFVALDRSGSMIGSRWTSAIDSLNKYVDGLKAENVAGDITIVAFSSDPYVNISTSENISNFKKISTEVTHPSGNTPLYDASAYVMDLAIAKNSNRTVVIILTDGEENSSKEYNQQQIKEKVSSITSKGWEVLFLGANFDASRYSSGSGLDSTKLRNFDLSDINAVGKTVHALATSTTAYATSGIAMNISVDVDVDVKR